MDENINSVEDELDAIRIKLYEQTKEMTTQERVTFLNQMIEEGLTRHGLKICYSND